jgi:hypothetical protein
MFHRGLCLGFAALCVACGSSTQDGGHDNNKMGAVGGLAGSAGGTTSTGAAGLAALVPVIPNLMCDTSAVSEKTCGDKMCPEVPSYLAAACTVNCCTTDGKCGTRNTLVSLATVQCTPPAVEDTRCPSTMAAGFVSAGCCDAQNQCGQLFGTSCIVLPTGTQARAPRKCDEAPDAGS